MDAIQFGRWLARRRRHHGFRSQRALAESIYNNPVLAGYGISEDFLSRLEAGHLAHPFRGNVRKQVIVLSALLCKSPRDVKAYLYAAELTKLDTDEDDQLRLLHKQIATPSSHKTLLLPPRPVRLIGREPLLQTIITTLCSMGSNLYAITGLPGVGKSALASEAVHLLAVDELRRSEAFPDGIAAFTCTGRRGPRGLLSLLEEIVTFFSPSMKHSYEPARKLLASDPLSSTDVSQAELARTIDAVRAALADKRVLLLLDDVDAQFPFRLALEALQGQQRHTTGREGRNSKRTRCVLFTTSRYVPAPAFMAHHLHLDPLNPQAAFDLLAILLGRSLEDEEVNSAQRISAAVGFLPLALEGAAAAAVGGIPLSLLAARLEHNPLDDLLDIDHEIRSRLASAWEGFDVKMRKRFAVLAALGVASFGLESAAALSTPTLNIRGGERSPASGASPVSRYLVHASGSDAIENNNGGASDSGSLDHLASTAADLGQFVRSSLLDLAPLDVSLSDSEQGRKMYGRNTRYHLHPLIHAHALSSLEQLGPEDIEEARKNAQEYALSYIERHRNQFTLLEREHDFLFASLRHAFYTEQYGYVLHFVEVLGRSCRLINHEEGKRILGWGIQACRHLHDRYHQVRFLHHLAWVYCRGGDFGAARQIWTEGLEIASSLKQPAHFIQAWRVLCGLAHLANIYNESDISLRYVKTFFEPDQESDDPANVADALHTHAGYARLQGDLDSAYDCVSSAIQVLSRHYPLQVLSQEYLVEMQVHAEMARLQGDYALSNEYTEIAATRQQEAYDYYAQAEILFDQACFALQLRMYPDVERLAGRIIAAATQIKSPQFHQRGTRLLRQAFEARSYQ